MHGTHTCKVNNNQKSLFGLVPFSLKLNCKSLRSETVIKSPVTHSAFNQSKCKQIMQYGIQNKTLCVNNTQRNTLCRIKSK